MKETTFEEQSSLKIYSLGIVVKAQDPVTKEIQVSPIESMNVQQPGVISQNKIEFRGSHPDDKGVSVTGNVKAENYVKAKWICIGSSNRVTAPNVYPNETVLLFRYSNNDVFYWTSIFHEPELRKKEAATFGVSNMSVAKGWTGNIPVAYTKDTGYWLDIDAVKKIVSFTTPDNDGEFAKYTFEINVADSILTIKDNKTNTVKLDSKKGIEVTSDLKVVIKGKAQVDIESSKLVNLKAPKVVVSGNLTVKGKITCNELAVNKAVQINESLNVNSITTNVVLQPWIGKKDISGVNKVSGGSSSSSSNDTADTNVDANGVEIVLDEKGNRVYTPEQQASIAAWNSANAAYDVESARQSNASTFANSGPSTEEIVAKAEAGFKARGLKPEDYVFELRDIRSRPAAYANVTQVAAAGYPGQYQWVSNSVANNSNFKDIGGGFHLNVTTGDTVLSATGIISATKAQAAVIASATDAQRPLQESYTRYLNRLQAEYAANPNSQAAKDAISKPPSQNYIDSPGFVAEYNGWSSYLKRDMITDANPSPSTVTGGYTSRDALALQAAAVVVAPVVSAATALVGANSPLSNALRNIST